MSEAQRRATQSYKEKLEREGVRVVSVRLNDFARKTLKAKASKHGCSQSEIIQVLLEEYPD